MAGSRTERPVEEQARTAVRGAVRTLADAAGEVESGFGTAAEVTTVGVRATSDALRQRSDATLGLLGAFAVGLTTGLLVGGAPRLLTMASLVPAALVGGVVLERVGRPRYRFA
jgi:hypothetical protein